MKQKHNFSWAVSLLEEVLEKEGGRLTLKLRIALSQDDLFNLAIRVEEILDLLLCGAKRKVANED
jgi:hypothetical protein